MATLKFTEERDLNIVNGKVVEIKDAEAIGQGIKTRLYTQLGECVYATNVGVPWFDIVFQKGADTNLATIENIISVIVEQVPGVIGVKDFMFPSYDPLNRVLSIAMKVDTINGEIDFSEGFVIEPFGL